MFCYYSTGISVVALLRQSNPAVSLCSTQMHNVAASRPNGRTALVPILIAAVAVRTITGFEISPKLAHSRVGSSFASTLVSSSSSRPPAFLFHHRLNMGVPLGEGERVVIIGGGIGEYSASPC